MYSVGLSYTKCSSLLECILGRNLESFITIWRDVQQLGERLRRAHLPTLRSGKVIVGLDGAYVKVRGKKQSSCKDWLERLAKRRKACLDVPKALWHTAKTSVSF